MPVAAVGLPSFALLSFATWCAVSRARRRQSRSAEGPTPTSAAEATVELRDVRSPDDGAEASKATGRTKKRARRTRRPRPTRLIEEEEEDDDDDDAAEGGSGPAVRLYTL